MSKIVTFNCENIKIIPNNYNEILVEIEIDSIKDLLKDIDFSYIEKYYGIEYIVKEIGIENIIKEIGIDYIKDEYNLTEKEE